VHINDLAFLVLTGLAGGPQYGYGIVKEIRDITDGKVTPPVASLYRVLDKMERGGQIVKHSTEVVDGPLRRLFRLTEAGRAALSEEAASRAHVVQQARRRLRGPGLAGGAA